MENINEIVIALAKARQEFKPIVASKKVEIPTKSGKIIRYQYAPLDSILESVVPALSANGLVLWQGTELKEDSIYLVTQLFHSSGQSLPASKFKLFPKSEPKEFAGQITYYRRYALCAYLNIAADEDKDAETVEQHGSTIQQPIIHSFAAQSQKIIAPYMKEWGKDAVLDVLKEENMPTSSSEFKTQEQITQLRELLENTFSIDSRSQYEATGVGI